MNLTNSAFGTKVKLINDGCSLTNTGTAVIGLPKGSTNSTDGRRINTSAFLAHGNVCPVGYEPGSSEPFPYLPDNTRIRFVVLRPQDLPALAASGSIDAFLAVEDLVVEAQEAGVGGIEKVIELPFAEVHVVAVAKQEDLYSTLGDLLLSSVREPILCVSELPFLAKKSFPEEKAYRERFGTRPPSIERHGRRIVDGCDRVKIVESAGSSEPQVRLGSFHCAVAVKSTGKTIDECRLKVIKVIGCFHPGFFCRSGLRNHETLQWFANRLKLALSKWREMQRRSQLAFTFADA